MFMNIYFESTSYLFSLPLLLFLFLVFFIEDRKKRKRQKAIFGKQIDNSFLLLKTSLKNTRLYRSALFLTVLLLLLSLSKPFFLVAKTEEKVDDVSGDALVASNSLSHKRPSKEIAFLLDTSYSMSVKDTRQGVSRLELAKDIIEELVGQLDGEEVALYAFTSEVTRLVPSTYDYLFFRLLNKQVELNEGDVAGTDLLHMLDYLDSQHYGRFKREAQAVILFTDGGDTRLEQLKGKNREQELSLILSRLGAFKERGVRFYTVGLGSQQGEIIKGISHDGKVVRSSLDEELLMKIASETKGEYYYAGGDSTLHLARNLRDQITNLEAKEQDSQEKIFNKESYEGSLLMSFEKRYVYQELILAALLLLMFCYLVKREVD
jgi:Ca-activated chloride channel homolog